MRSTVVADHSSPLFTFFCTSVLFEIIFINQTFRVCISVPVCTHYESTIMKRLTFCVPCLSLRPCAPKWQHSSYVGRHGNHQMSPPPHQNSTGLCATSRSTLVRCQLFREPNYSPTNCLRGSLQEFYQAHVGSLLKPAKRPRFISFVNSWTACVITTQAHT